MRTRYFAAGAAVVAAAVAVAGAAISADGAAVPYPDGYRAWRHVKSMVIEPGHALHASFGGIHHLYANDKAMKGYESGTFPDGAVIVFDLLEAVSADHAVTEGKRKVVGVMHRDAKKLCRHRWLGIRGVRGRQQDRARRR